TSGRLYHACYRAPTHCTEEAPFLTNSHLPTSAHRLQLVAQLVPPPTPQRAQATHPPAQSPLPKPLLPTRLNQRHQRPPIHPRLTPLQVYR
ncbi:hypothetical protein BDY19DRAFT_976339, partial [Irpex rosettiformis]